MVMAQPARLSGEISQVGIVQGQLVGAGAALHQQLSQHGAALANELRDGPRGWHKGGTRRTGMGGFMVSGGFY